MFTLAALGTVGLEIGVGWMLGSGRWERESALASTAFAALGLGIVDRRDRLRRLRPRGRHRLRRHRHGGRADRPGGSSRRSVAHDLHPGCDRDRALRDSRGDRAGHGDRLRQRGSPGSRSRSTSRARSAACSPGRPRARSSRSSGGVAAARAARRGRVDLVRLRQGCRFRGQHLVRERDGDPGLSLRRLPAERVRRRLRGRLLRGRDRRLGCARRPPHRARQRSDAPARGPRQRGRPGPPARHRGARPAPHDAAAGRHLGAPGRRAAGGDQARVRRRVRSVGRPRR